MKVRKKPSSSLAWNFRRPFPLADTPFVSALYGLDMDRNLKSIGEKYPNILLAETETPPARIHLSKIRHYLY